MNDKIIGRYYVFSDIGGYSDQESWVKSFEAEWIVPSKPIQSSNKCTLYLGIKLGAYGSKTMLAPTLTWDSQTGIWFVSCLYDDEGTGQISEGKRVNVQPGELLHARIALVSLLYPPYVYEVYFIGIKYTSTKIPIMPDNAANKLIVKFDQSTNNYADLPPRRRCEDKKYFR